MGGHGANCARRQYGSIGLKGGQAGKSALCSGNRIGPITILVWTKFPLSSRYSAWRLNGEASCTVLLILDIHLTHLSFSQLLTLASSILNIHNIVESIRLSQCQPHPSTPLRLQDPRHPTWTANHTTDHNNHLV